jgi:hypothetical protein
MLRRAEADGEAGVVKVDHIIKGRSRRVVEVRRSHGGISQQRRLNVPISAHLPVTIARPGSVVRTLLLATGVTLTGSRIVGHVAPVRL